MTFRWVDGQIDEIDMPTTRVVKIAEIDTAKRP
jgi:hypothetical protein